MVLKFSAYPVSSKMNRNCHRLAKIVLHGFAHEQLNSLIKDNKMKYKEKYPLFISVLWKEKFDKSGGID